MKNLLKAACLLAAILCLLCSVALATDVSPKQSQLPLTTDKETLTIYCEFNAAQQSVYKSLDEHPVVKQIEEETGIDLQFMHPPVNDDGTFFNTTIASGNWPDLWYTDKFQTTYPGGVEGAMDDELLLNVAACSSPRTSTTACTTARWSVRICSTSTA